MTRRRAALLAGLAVILVMVAVVILIRRERPSEPPRQTPSASDSSLLVLTWAPSLCTVESSASGCRSGSVGRRGPNFLLHGLWPQPRSQQYCDVPRKSRDRDRPPLDLPPDLSARLAQMMSDSTVMAPHEWYAHGTCSGVTPSEYFSLATGLAQQAIDVLDPLFDRESGRQVTSRAVRDTVETRLGPGAGSRVALACRDAKGRGPVVYEVRLSLPPVVRLRETAPSLAEALAAGPTVGPGCGKATLP